MCVYPDCVSLLQELVADHDPSGAPAALPFDPIRYPTVAIQGDGV